MKTLITIITLILLATSCAELDIYESYQIKEGEYYATMRMELIDRDVLSFDAIFDSTAMLREETSQGSNHLHKLLGVADYDAHPSVCSASFGWKWENDQIEIFALSYSNGAYHEQKIASAQVGENNYYEILLTSENYIFTFNDQQVTLPRDKAYKGSHYVLYPAYASENEETAPHDINIMIRRQKIGGFNLGA